jgi:hypothetical protein
MRVLKRNLVAYAICVVAFTVALTLVYCIPSSLMSQQVKESADLLSKEGNYPTIATSSTSLRLDNYTNAIMLNIAAHDAEGASPLAAAMLNGEYASGASTNRIGSLAEGIGQQSNWSYPRYWNGYLAYLKPLLIFLNLGQIRLLSLAVVVLLAAWVYSLLMKRSGTKYALAFAFSLVFVEAFMVAFSPIQTPSFLIALLAMAYVLKAAESAAAFGSEREWGTVFFVIGALTVFFELLCTPIVTLGLPLVAYMVARKDDLGKVSRKQMIRFLAICCLWWLAGYVALWLTKWVLATFVLGKDVIADGFRSLVYRSSGSSSTSISDGGTTDAARWEGALNNVKALLPGWKAKASLVVLALAVFGAVRYRRRGWTRLVLPLLTLAALPYLFYLGASNFAYIHYWFAYRAQVVSVFAIVCLVLSSIDWDGVQEDLRKLALAPKKAHTSSKK